MVARERKWRICRSRAKQILYRPNFLKIKLKNIKIRRIFSLSFLKFQNRPNLTKMP